MLLNPLQSRAVRAINKYLPKKTLALVDKPKVKPKEPEVKTEAQRLTELITGEFHLEAPLEFSHLPKEPENKHNFLLLGPAGSGKTTVITNAIDTNKLNVAFCAFTNKATQVLKTISTKFGVTFNADFMTIHKLLMLRLRYESNDKVSFDFNTEAIGYLKQYDVIIFDECSTISTELFTYIQEAWEYIFFKYNHSIKFIFLGDYWQLSPVGEHISSVFAHANKEKWSVSKLSSVMRAGNDEIQSINQRLLKYVDVFRKKTKKPLDSFVIKYPYNLVRKQDHPNMYLSNTDIFHKYFMKLWKSDSDTVMLTYSKKNCCKTNFAIQDLIDIDADRMCPVTRTDPQFYVGDRCCIDKPVDICHIKYMSDKTPHVLLDSRTGESLYNGEIFDVIAVENVLVRTQLNKLAYITNYFPGQILTVRRIADTTDTYDIIHIAETIVEAAKKKIKRRGRKQFFEQLFSSYIKQYPKLTYGYCITVYKSQGSEWRNVLINLNSIKWSIAGPGTDVSLKKKSMLFRTTYTSMSRASHSLKLFWF